MGILLYDEAEERLIATHHYPATSNSKFDLKISGIKCKMYDQKEESEVIQVQVITVDQYYSRL